LGGLIPRCGITAPRAPLCTGQGVDHHVGRAQPPRLHRRRRLDGEPFCHQRGIETRATLGEDFGEHNRRRGAIRLDLADPTSIHHRHVGASSATALFVGTGQLLFQELPRQPHPR
jgi:hypothetical protein